MAETVLIFAIFFIQGAWPVPDVNEAHYLGKAIHYWNPHWIENDFFLNSADTHRVFYSAFGWLSLFLAAPTLAWVGRILTWGLLAWSWRRLSVALVPRPWFAILSGALFAYLIERGHMAGEWVLGGIEAKGFAYVLVFLGLEALVRDRWNRAWMSFGAAGCFHVLVGGWAAVAAGLAWVWQGRQRPPLRSMWPGLVGGLALSLPGLVPSLLLDWGTDVATVRQAHEIYVYKRLAHHLVFGRFPLILVVRFLALVGAFALLGKAVAKEGFCGRFRATALGTRQPPWDCGDSAPPSFEAAFDGPEKKKAVSSYRTPNHTSPLLLSSPAGNEGGLRRLRAFVFGSLAIAMIGVALGLIGEFAPDMMAGVLRYYWFRLSDAAVPLGVALLATLWGSRLRDARSPKAGWILATLAAICGIHLACYAIERPPGTLPRGDKRVRHPEWQLACEWIAQSGSIPPDAVFLSPMESQTFKWRAQRAEVVTRKDIPQDARAIVEWWRRLREIHGAPVGDPERQWRASLTELGAARLKDLGAKYGASYLLTEAEPRLPLERLYANRAYAVYRLTEGP